jgi:hypothetical protein
MSARTFSEIPSSICGQPVNLQTDHADESGKAVPTECPVSLIRRIRKISSGLAWYRAAIICVAALGILSARSAPPSFPHIAFSSAVHSRADHDHRQQYLAHEEFQWATFSSTTLTAPPLVVSPPPVRPDECFLEIVMGGWHYNRPPPTS